MDQPSKGSLWQRGLPLRWTLYAALVAGAAAVAPGCPGPSPATTLKGSGGESSSEHTSGSMGSVTASSGSNSSTTEASSTSGSGAGGAVSTSGPGGMIGAGGVIGAGGLVGIGGVVGVGGLVAAGGATATGGSGGMSATSSSSASSSSSSSSSGTVCPGGGECLEPVPSGWQGPYQVYTGSSGAVAACGNATTPVYVGGPMLSFGPAVCQACSCQPAAGWQCSPPVVTLETGTSCSGGQTCGGGTPGSNCAQLPSSCAGTSPTWVLVDSAAAGTGGCMPNKVSPPVKPTPTWSPTYDVCPLSGTATACGNGGVCASPPNSSNPFVNCIATAGMTTCPLGSSYSNQIPIFTNYTDTRGCGDCSCGTTVSCTGSVILSSDPTCGAPMTYPIGHCSQGPATQPTASTIYAELGSGPTPTCPPAGGQPNGTVTPNTPVTVCCTM